MKRVIIADEAELEIVEAGDFYEASKPGLGLDFEEAAREAVRRIQLDPERYPKQNDGTRRYVMRRFPFVVRYLDLPEYIWIVAFAHTSRRPGYWKTRMRFKP